MRLCVSLSGTTPAALHDSLHRNAALADLAEIRLDLLDRPDSLDCAALIAKSPCPLIFTNRAPAEGGRFQGSEEERIGLLLRAVRQGARYVDLELAAEPRLRGRLMEAAKSHGTRTILSFHDFSATPPDQDLRATLSAQRENGADIGKIVTMAHGPRDIAAVCSLHLQAMDMAFPLIAFCMGPQGKLSRLACLGLGAYLTYAAPAAGLETAPGQIPIEDLRRMADYFAS